MKLPENYLAAMKELLGEEYEAYLASFEEPKSLGLRVNTRKISVEDFLKLTPFHLTPVPWTENGFYYEEGRLSRGIPTITRGCIISRSQAP